jgi:ubiquinone/menaquinone biosynthesis C-methylase UbiE
MKNNQTMKDSWNNKAIENAYHWVDSSKKSWNKEEYYEKGQEEIDERVISYLTKTYSFEQIKKFNVLDVGCGTGRLVRGMSKYFNSVTGIDVSSKMLAIAKKDNNDLVNVSFLKSNGVNFDGLKDNSFDFIFSFIVFQHIPSRSIVINNIKEISRVLKRGGLSKFQVRGLPGKINLSVTEKRYKGFNFFYIALDKKLGMPFPVIRKYNTVYGCFFKKKELAKILKKYFKKYNIYFDKNNPKYLWAEVIK